MHFERSEIGVPCTDFEIVGVSFVKSIVDFKIRTVVIITWVYERQTGIIKFGIGVDVRIGVKFIFACLIRGETKENKAVSTREICSLVFSCLNFNKVREIVGIRPCTGVRARNDFGIGT